jgi:hypothetical protein
MGEQEYQWSEYSNRWEFESRNPCGLRSGSGEGLAPGGLNEQQADAYIRWVRSEYGDPISVERASLVEHQGKAYIRLPVTVRPVRHPYGYSGMQLFLWGLHGIGVHPTSIPYSMHMGNTANGVRITYYVDPGTTLPAYSFARSTPSLGDDGKPREPGERLGVYRTEYAFPPEWRGYDSANPQDLAPIDLTWDHTMQ